MSVDIDELEWLAKAAEPHARMQVQARNILALIAEHRDMQECVKRLRKDCESKVRWAEDVAHYANGVADLAIKHRDVAEAAIAEMREACARVVENLLESRDSNSLHVFAYKASTAIRALPLPAETNPNPSPQSNDESDAAFVAAVGTNDRLPSPNRRRYSDGGRQVIEVYTDDFLRLQGIAARRTSQPIGAEDLLQVREAVRLLAEALGFYANRDNWSIYGDKARSTLADPRVARLLND